jgi:hypothetical protein
MKTIEYKVKTTAAYTQYRETQPADRKWVLDNLRDIQDLYNLAHFTLQADMHRPNKNIPRQGRQNGGRSNSILSAATGILSNIEDGTQRDFSNHTCDIIEKTFKELNKLITDWEPVKFTQVGEFTQQVLQQPIQTTLSDLFDTQVYEVTGSFTVRRKQ